MPIIFHSTELTLLEKSCFNYISRLYHFNASIFNITKHWQRCKLKWWSRYLILRIWFELVFGSHFFLQLKTMRSGATPVLLNAVLLMVWVCICMLNNSFFETCGLIYSMLIILINHVRSIATLKERTQSHFLPAENAFNTNYIIRA